MKRILFVVALVLVATSAFALDPNVRGNRIGILDFAFRDGAGPDARVAEVIQHQLLSELARRGFDAFDTRQTLDVLRRVDTPSAADYYIEIAGSGEDAAPMGSVGVGAGAVYADIGIIVSHVAAEVRVYDGRNLGLVDSFSLNRHSTAVVPTGIGAGHVAGNLAIWAALPVARWFHYRGAAHDVARDAAAMIQEKLGRGGA